MDYETALALKNAGFPQRHSLGLSEVITKHGRMDNHSANEMGYTFVVIPTLEEVIEEIGDDFQELKKYQMNSQWYATAFSQRTDAGEKIVIEGRTPLLAVVALYLALKQKKPH